MKPTSSYEFFSSDLGLTSCAFCEQVKELQLSHVLPKFVVKWLRETSGTGHIRASTTPNRRIQDGWKARMLCWDCEQLFGAWEKAFAEGAFFPLHNDRFASIEYGPWFSRFAAAQSWRTLRAYSLRDGLSDHFPESLLPFVDRALAKWKAFLLGDLPNPGTYEQHGLRVDIIKQTSMQGLPPNINRYLSRALDLDVVSGQRTAFVYSKLARIILVGFIQMPRATPWRGTRISPTSGRFGISDSRVPGEFGEFLIAKARRMGQAAAQISEVQRQRISEAVAEDTERAGNSEIAEAIMQDVSMFGDLAFSGFDQEEPDSNYGPGGDAA